MTAWSLQTLLPILLLSALAAWLPFGLHRGAPDTMRALGRVALWSVLMMICAGVAVFALAYALGGAGPAALARDPAASAVHLGGLGLRSALIWGPVLGLSLIGLGTRIEARRSKAREASEAETARRML